MAKPVSYVCLRDCQIHLPVGTDADGKPTGKITWVARGEVIESEKAPRKDCFAPLDGSRNVDFLLASEAELLASEWSFKDAKEFMQEQYNVVLKAGSKDKLVAAIMDARYRNQS